MKPYLAITIFLTLIIPAVATSWGSYKITEACIINDLNQAWPAPYSKRTSASSRPTP